MVADPATLKPVPNDGATMGEIFMRSNTVMSGFLKNPKATREAFERGWFHTGDLGVSHPNGYIELKAQGHHHLRRPSSTGIRRCSRPGWWSAPTRSGARRRARSRL
jgi:acyl-CoA synthetase (AMP-forming)/AMP-acid ligase II